LKEEFEGSDRVKTVKLLTLKREFEMLKMKDEELVKDYSSKVLELVNKIRLLGEAFPDERVVEKMMISLLAKFESKISAIEESCDLKTLTVAELISKLQTQEQRSIIRDGEVTEGAFQAKQNGRKSKKEWKKYFGDKSGKEKAVSSSKEPTNKGKFPPYRFCQRMNHLEKYCWFKDKPPIQCRFCKKMGHIEKNCRVKQNQGQEKPFQKANYTEEERRRA